MHLKISGHMLATSPFHSSVPGAAAWDPVRERVIGAGAESGAFPLTRTRRMPVYYAGGRVLRVPVVPAATVRKQIRMAAAGHVFDHLAARGERVSPVVYHSMTAGTASGHPEKERLPTNAEYRALARHPFHGLFGGGSSLSPSRLVTDTGYALVRELFGADGPFDADDRSLDVAVDGTWVDDEGRIRYADLVHVVPVSRGEMLFSLRDPRARERVADFESEADRYRGLLQEVSGSATRQGKETRALRISSLTYMEVTPPGLAYSFRAETRPEATPAQCALLLLAVRRVVSEGRPFGGRSALGLGRFRFDLRARITDETEAGDELPEGALPLDSPELDGLLDALDTEMESVTAAGLEALYRDPWLEAFAKKTADEKPRESDDGDA